MTEVLASFLLPVREAAETTWTSLRSIRDLSSDTIPYEILIRFDDDDDTYQELLPKIAEIFDGSMAEVTVVIGSRHGYEGLHEYYNELAALSVGKLLVLWNDDVQILPVRSGWEKPGGGAWIMEAWDLILKEDLENMESHIFMLFPTEVYWDLPEAGPDVKYGKGITALAFPILTRSAYEIMGRYSPSPLNDAYILDISTLKLEGKLIRKRSRLMLLHQPAFDAKTGMGLRVLSESYKIAYNLHSSDEIRNEVTKDMEKLQKFWEERDE